MADLLINGLPLPKKGEAILAFIFPSGRVDYKYDAEMATHRTTAIELSSHGRLIDAEKLQAVLLEWEELARCGGNFEFVNIYKTVREIIDDRDCVVGASNGNNN